MVGLIEKNSGRDQLQGIFTRSAVLARDHSEECAIGGLYGMGNRGNGNGSGFSDRRSNLYHYEKMNLLIIEKRGGKTNRF